MKINLKILLASHIALLVTGFTIGFMINKEPSVGNIKTKVKYLSSTKLGLPKFNAPSLTPSNRIYFLPGKTKIKRDTVLVMVPEPYSKDFLVTKRKPISQQGNELQFKYFDPAMDKQIIDTYSIHASLWRFGVHIDVDSPVYKFRPKVGPKLVFGYKGIKLNIKAQLDFIDPNKSILTAGTSIRLFGNN